MMLVLRINVYRFLMINYICLQRKYCIFISFRTLEQKKKLSVHFYEIMDFLRAFLNGTS
jgi:hypothetical protein